MSALIIRMPPDKRERLKQVAKSRNVSVNKLIDEMATLAIAEHDAETRFRTRAKRAAAAPNAVSGCCARLPVVPGAPSPVGR
jgi:hypothetical protein